MNSIPIVGGLSTAIFGDPNQEAHQQQLAQNKADIAAYRPEVLRARLNAMNQGALAFNPLNNLMGQMYGQGAQMDMKQMMQNPFATSNRSYKDAFGGHSSYADAFSGNTQKMPSAQDLWINKPQQPADTFRPPMEGRVRPDGRRY